MGVTRVWSVCVVFWTGSRSGGSEAQRGVYRSRGGRGGEPLDIHISIQVTRESFNANSTPYNFITTFKILYGIIIVEGSV